MRTNPKFTLINVAGFAFAISVSLAITLFLLKEYSYDRYNKNYRQIIRLTDAKKNSSEIDYRVKDILLQHFPEVKNACYVDCYNHPVELKYGKEGTYLHTGAMSVDPQFFNMFSVPVLAQQTATPFQDKNSVVITESTAKRLFPNENPLGKELDVYDIYPVTVSAVIKDFPANSSFTANFIVNAQNDNFKFKQAIGNSDDLSTYRWPFEIYVQLKKNEKPEQLIAKINAHKELLKPYVEKAGFLPLKDIYLHDPTTGVSNRKGNAKLLQLFAAIGLIILILAVINYINLTVAQQAKRNKESGIRKTIGASRKQIIGQLVAESTLIGFSAFLIGTLLLRLMLPAYEVAFNTPLNFNILYHFPTSIVLLLSILILGLVSGIGPGFVLSGINPVKILSGTTFISGKKNYLRQSLTVFQFAVSVILIVSVLIVRRQIQYVKHQDLGFNQEQLLRLDIPWLKDQDMNKTSVLASELKKSPYIRDASVSQGVPGDIRFDLGYKNETVPSIVADSSFIKTMGLHIIKGRAPQPSDFGKVCLINETGYKHFGFTNLDNKRFNNYGGYDIIGVVNDFHYSSMRKPIGPAFIILASKGFPNAISIRLSANHIGETMKFIHKTWQNVMPGYPYKYEFYDDWFNSMYKSEERLAQTMSIFALLAIVISCMGMLGLAIFAAERRTKEIGIRKVNGAKVSEVMAMLNKDFIKWVGIAFVIATPVAWYTMNLWLEDFAYRTGLSWWIFILAGFLALVIALLTVSWHSYRAATRNPIEALRYE